jgi:hypothetical protein
MIDYLRLWRATSACLAFDPTAGFRIIATLAPKPSKAATMDSAAIIIMVDASFHG